MPGMRILDAGCGVGGERVVDENADPAKLDLDWREALSFASICRFTWRGKSGGNSHVVLFDDVEDVPRHFPLLPEVHCFLEKRQWSSLQ